MTARVVEKSKTPCLWVNGLRRYELAVIAALTGPRQIIKIVVSITALRNDVFDAKIIRGMIRRTAAILASALGSILNRSPDLNTNHSDYST
jgi:hypothetical protein